MWYAVIFFVSLLLDQASKTIVFKNGKDIELIPNILNIELRENTGAGFSMLADYPWASTFFIVVSSVMIAAIVLMMIIIKKRSKFFLCSTSLLLSGAVGNLIDRLVFGYVRDFIDLPPLRFNCNVADIAISASVVMLAIFYLFLDEYAILKKKEKREKQPSNSENSEEDEFDEYSKEENLGKSEASFVEVDELRIMDGLEVGKTLENTESNFNESIDDEDDNPESSASVLDRRADYTNLAQENNIDNYQQADKTAEKV